MTQKALSIAMWSGPRNISTALMRSWGNRPDTYVCDKPFYAHYLVQTKLVHPGGDEVIRLGYYLRHLDEVDEYLERCRRATAQVRQENDRRFSPLGVRDRLLARRTP